jgi:alcohol dehydrogenase class IV
LLDPAAGGAGGDRETLPQVLIALMRDVGIPNGIGAVGFGKSDVPALVEGALKQQRILAASPKPVSEEDAAGILTRSISLW